jgi:hypothetical protein
MMDSLRFYPKIFLALSFLLVLPVASAHIVSDEGDFYYLTLLHFPPNDAPAAGENTSIQISIFNASTGEPQTGLDVVHERKMHVFVVGKDLKTFAHIHPEDSPDGFDMIDRGTYSLDYVFPSAGVYLIAVDYTINGRTIVKNFLFDVTGENKLDKPNLELSREGTFDGYHVTLNAPEKILVGQEVEFGYHIERGGVEVKDLQHLLGSEMHVVDVRSDMTDAGHTHAYIPGHTLHIGSMPQRYYGPDIPVRHTFGMSGKYVLFGQFMHDDKIVTTRFVVNVEDSPEYHAIVILIYVGIAAFAFYVFRYEIIGLLTKNRKAKFINRKRTKILS